VKTLIVSDIHSNATALQAVLEDAGAYDRVWCLGDVVGYGPEPNECIEILKTLPNLTCLLGNHDAAVMEFIDLRTFNDEARRALEVQMHLLSEESRQFLELLKPKDVQEGVTLAHGSPRDPIWEYVMSAKVAERNFSAFETQVCLIGHSHIPVIFVENERRTPQVLMPSSGDMWRSQQRFLLNPGSVGQPRDRDPRAAYVLWDSEENTWTYHRIAYDVASVQEEILALGIPTIHAMRLAYGM